MTWDYHGKRNTNKTTQNDGLSALQIFMIIQTFVFVLSCVQMVLVKKKINKTENSTQFLKCIYGLFSHVSDLLFCFREVVFVVMSPNPYCS